MTDGNETLGKADLTNWRNSKDAREREMKFVVIASGEEEKEANWKS